ncbi:MAG: VanW family protein, partial [Rhodococcus sp. (in: high G+C Gram-positive bacteria)]
DERSSEADAAPPTVDPQQSNSEPAAAVPTAQLSTDQPSGVVAQEPSNTSGPGEISSRKKVAVLAGAAIAILAVFYAADMLSSSGSVPRGVSVAGIAVGGMSHDDAETRLQSELGPRVDGPVQVTAGDQQLEVVPAAAGLDVDWTATLDRAGSQPINPFTRITSFFADREIGVESSVDAVALDAAVESLRAQTDRQPIEGNIVFEGATPVPVTPSPGQSMDVEGTRDALVSDWAFGTVEASVETVDVVVHQDEVDRALADVATPATSAPVVFSGRDNVDAVLAPDAIGRILSFESDGQGALVPRYDLAAATGILAPQLVSTETPPKDASFALGGGAPTVVPGVVGELVQWPRTLEQLPTLLTSTDIRTTEAVYEQAQPALTTEGAQALGINEVIGEYTTGGFEYASGVNIGLTADIVNGALVKPGETFSLNGHTGPRGFAQGFVESGIIDNGRPDRAVGGGISQFATTLYNAAYFGGMEDAGHTEHSYYISRYPEAREATVFEGAIDLQFTNPTKTGVVIESFATSSNVTVRLWGTKTVDVQSITGARSNPTSPNTITLPAGSGCVPSGGGPGFTASDTRVVSDIATGSEISRNTRTVKYDPIPIVRCVSPEPEREPDEPGPAPAPAPPPEDGE